MAKKVKKLVTVSVKKPKKKGTIYSTPLPEVLFSQDRSWWSFTRTPLPGWVSGVLLGACLVIMVIIGIATS